MGVAEHYDLAKKLRRMSAAHASVHQAGDPNWDAVMLFYSALHVTQAYLISAGGTVARTHTALDGMIAARKELDARFTSAYRSLADFAWNVRYNPGFVMTAANKTTAAGRFRVVAHGFVESPVRAHLGLQPGNEL